MKDFFTLDGKTYNLNELSTARLRQSLPNRILLYLQSFASEDFSFDKSYSYGLFRSPQPANLDKHETEQSGLDYVESSNITNTSEDEILSDIEFILSEARLRELVLEGTAEIAAQLRIRADGTYTTYLTKVRANLFRRDSDGNDTAILSNKIYDFDTNVSHSADGWDDKVAIKIHADISRVVVPQDERLVLRLEVFGYVSSADASNNKCRLYFSRGSTDSYLILPVIEGF